MRGRDEVKKKYMRNSKKFVREGRGIEQERKLTGELDVELVLRLEDLDVEGAVGGEVLHSPGSKDGLVVLRHNTSSQPTQSCTQPYTITCTYITY